MQDEVPETGAFRSSAELHSVWTADPVHLPHIRALTRGWLQPLTLGADTEYDVVLAVNEAASNAIEHAYLTPGPSDLVAVSFWTEPRHLYIEVADDGRWRPRDTDPDHRGSGILIMQKIVESVSILKELGGTRVLLIHPIPARSGPAAARR